MKLNNENKKNTTLKELKIVNQTSLDLYDNNIGDEGATALAEALKENTTLTTLNLASNKIGDEGATALAEALKENKNLIEVLL